MKEGQCQAALASKSEQPERIWGSREFFHHLFTTQGYQDTSAYFGENGYHLYRHRQLVECLARTALPRVREAMLDIGCGPGSSTVLISRRCGFRTSCGMDFTPALVTHAVENHPRVHFQVGALPWIPYRSATMNLVIACEVLYYLPKDQQEQALDEISRVLKRGGAFLFSSALGKEYFEPEAILVFLSKRFEVVRYEYSYNRLYHLLLGPLYLLRRLHQSLEAGVEPGTRHSTERMRRYSWLADRKAFRILLRGISFLSDPVLRLPQIPALLGGLCRVCCPWLTKTNIMLVARKRD